MHMGVAGGEGERGRMLALIRLLWWVFWWGVSTLLWMVIMAVWPFLFVGGLLIVYDEEGQIVRWLRIGWRWYWRQRELRLREEAEDDGLDASQL